MRILLAEDDLINRVFIVRLLEKLGCEVLCAENGQEAVCLLEQQDVDAILMDIQMPIMDGVEAAQTIRCGAHLGPKQHVPIIATTAYAVDGDRERFLAAGMNDYIPKPLDLARLRQALGRVSKRR
ncbi:hypothetical protein MASR1M90_12600 [Desulfovibrionales bacterium]